MKPIPGFPGYTITEAGVITNPKGKVLTRKDSWEGYPRARLKHESGLFKNRKIHTLVALAHLGEGKEVRHLDNNRANFHLHNLEWGDRDSNAQDRLARGSYHLKTKLVGGKSLLILGDDKYLDPEAKKVYHVTDHPLGEDGVIPITSLEKVAGLFKFLKKPGLVDSVKYKYNAKPIISKSKINLENEGFVAKKDLLPSQFTLAKYRKAFQNAGFEKRAEWTSKKNAESHALKHAGEMGLTKEQYISLGNSALKGKLSLINIKNDVHKSRSGKNIVIHKDKKVISLYPMSKVAYLHKVRRHVRRVLETSSDPENQMDALGVYQTHRENKKKK